MDDYNKNEKPIVSAPATERPIKQGSQNLSPVTRPVASKAAFSEEVMPKNKVTSASSSKLQKAGRLPGRMGAGGSHKALS